MFDERIIGPLPSNGTQSTCSIQLSARGLIPGFFVCLLLLLSWLVPAGVGLSTQIRKSLPSFAHPPRTIWAAALLESHRLVYTGAATCLLLMADGAIRWKGWTAPSWWRDSFWEVVVLTAATISALGWIGPLRSDYTHQLIQSRRHGLRILIMYCWALPLMICGTIWWFYSTRGY